MSKKVKYRGVKEINDSCKKFLNDNRSSFNKSQIARYCEWHQSSLFKWLSDDRGLPDGCMLPMVEFCLEKGMNLPYEYKQKLEVVQIMKILNKLAASKERKKEEEKRICKGFDERISVWNGDMKINLMRMLDIKALDLLLSHLPHHFKFTPEYKARANEHNTMLDIFFTELN